MALSGHPIYIFSMKRLSSLLALFLAPLSALSTTPQRSFEQIAKQADAARVADRMGEAIGLYTQGVRLHPAWGDGWWWLGSLLYDEDRFAEAAPAFKKFVALTPKSGPGYAFLALCEYETQDFGSSMEHFGEWARRGSPGNDALLDVAGFRWASLLTREGRFNEALYVLAAKAAKVGRSPALVEAMGLASLRMNNLPEDYPPERRELVWLTGEAAYYSATGATLRASQYADRLLLHYSHELGVHFFRGTLFEFQKDFGAAKQEYEEELRASPDNGAAMTELAVTLVDDVQPDKAVPIAERAVSLEPENPRAYYALGSALLETGKPEQGARALEKAKQIAPNSSFIRFTLAKAYRALGREQEAKRESAAFLALKDKQDVLAWPENRRATPEQVDVQGTKKP